MSSLAPFVSIVIHRLTPYIKRLAGQSFYQSQIWSLKTEKTEKSLEGCDRWVAIKKKPQIPSVRVLMFCCLLFSNYNMPCFDLLHASVKSDGFEERKVTKNIPIFHLAMPSLLFSTNLRTLVTKHYGQRLLGRKKSTFCWRIHASHLWNRSTVMIRFSARGAYSTTSREGVYLRQGAFSGQGNYFFFEKKPNVKNKI